MSKRSKFGWLDFLVGLGLLALGIYTFIHPQIALSGIIVVYSVLAIVSGIADIVFYVRLKSNTGFGAAISLVGGILSILVGFMLLLNPVLGRWIFYIVFPVWFIAHSISRLANYRRIRILAGRGAAIASLVLNILGLVLGILMAFSPLLSSLSLGYLVAATLVLHGVGRIVESFSRLGEDARTSQTQQSMFEQP